MEGNYRPTHSANSTNYNSAPADMDGANTAPFTVSYDQTGVNNPQAPQQSYSQAGNFAYDSSYSPASFSPAPIGPQFSYATSDAGYGNGSNVNMGSRVADAVRNIDTDRIAGNIESGIGYVTDKAGKFTTAAKDKLANPNRRKALAIMGGAVASLALAMSLGNAVLNKTNNSSYDQTPPTATSNNSSAGSNQTEEVKDTDPNMNVETADSEHDGKISYKVYEYDFTRGYDNYTFVGDRTSQVEYSDSDTVNDRKEASMDDFIECISKQGDSTTRCNSIDEVFAKEEDYHGANAFVDLLKKYGGYNNGDITKLEKHNYIIDQKGVYMRNICDYHFKELASVNPAITDGVLRIYVANSNADGSKNPYNQYGYGGKFTIDITNLYVSPDHKRPRNGGLIAHNFNSGRIVCDQMPTEKELIQIIKDNYDSIFKVDNHPNNRGALEGVMNDRRKP